MQNTINQSVRISAKVFRAHKLKPWYVPEFFWGIAKQKRLAFAGRWEELGVIASSEKGTAEVL